MPKNGKYFVELVINWRTLLAAAIGLGGGTAIYSYTASLFAPSLIEEFGWTRAEYSIVGTTSFLSLIGIPLAGRLADIVGVRKTALIGVIGLPLCFIAYSFMTGSLIAFLAISSIKLLIGATTTSAVYSRLIAEKFERARGLALSIAICGPPVVAAMCAPILSEIIDTSGWRAGFRALAVIAAVAGTIALISIPARQNASRESALVKQRRGFHDYRAIVRSRAFWIILVAMILCNLPQTLPYYHLKLLMLAKGSTPAEAAYMVSLYAMSIIGGRFACGLALDRWPTHIVSAVAMGLPSLGLFIFASELSAFEFLFIAVFLIGLSQGAEGDLAAYLVARYFDIKVYGSVMGLVVAAISSATAVGAAILSLMLSFADDYTPFLLLTGLAVLAGGGSFLFLGSQAAHQAHAAAQ